MKKYTFLFAAVVILTACNLNTQLGKKGGSDKTSSETSISKVSSIDDKIANLKNSKNKEVIVVAHRADWRNAPENSLRAIQSCIDMGVDMIEIDVRKTKDDHLVLMHDSTIDRTTTGKGLVSDITFEELQKLFLKDGTGQVTRQKVPTLKEALKLAKDKILVNLDKAYSIFDVCYEVAVETGTVEQLIIKGTKPRAQVEKEFGKYLDKIIYMPVIYFPKEDSKEILEEYLQPSAPVAIEFVLQGETDIVNEFKELREKGISIWVNSLWASLCLGHDDESAAVNPDVYNWYIQNDIDIIQTDRPALLLEYLRQKGLHN